MTRRSAPPRSFPTRQRPASPAAPADASTVARGRRAEELALRFLKRQGLKPVARNYRCRAGEIDLVMTKAGTVVFVEVRSRTSRAFVSPKETVDWRKQRRLAKVAAWFLRSRRDLAGARVRFDVVSVTNPDYSAKMEWIRNAFEVDDYI